MLKLVSRTRYLVVVLLCALFTASTGNADSNRYTIENTPVWVEPLDAFDTSLGKTVETGHGFHDRLNELQFNVTEPGNTRVFNAVEYELTSIFGVENFSEIEISFNQSYQSLSVHELTVKRGDQLIDHLGAETLRLAEADQDPIGFRLGGMRTVRIELADIQVGDIVRYSYTLSGEDPVFQGKREFHFNTELWTQLDRQYVRVLTQSENPLIRRIRGEDVSLAVKDINGIQEIIFDQRAVTMFQAENDVPSWRETRGTVVFSDMKNWQDVVQWALPVFAIPENSSERIVAIADHIRSSYDEPRAQIGAALRWVQEEIEFDDAELLTDSELQSVPDITIRLRYGDRRDKAVLLMALLRELGVDSSAALVNTDRGLEAGNFPFRLRAFDHVLVHVEHEGEAHFIDPTRRSQSGALGEMYEPNYGRALLLNADTVDLTSMGAKRSAVRLAVKKELLLPAQWAEKNSASNSDTAPANGQTAGLTVVSSKQGLLAERVRDKLQIAGENYLSKSYLDYYQALYPSITVLDSVSLNEKPKNLATSTESYAIDNFWEVDEKVGEHRWIYADDIIGYLNLPKKTENRKRPYELLHPVEITETWVVPTSTHIRTHLEDAKVENEWVSFTKTGVISEDENTLTVTFTYATLANEVSARDLDVYVQSVEEINDHASFYLQNAPLMAAASEAMVLPWNTTKVKIWVVFIGLIYFTGWWLHFMKRYRRAAEQYSE